MKDVYIISAKRTPVGGYLGSLSGLSASQLGSHALLAATAGLESHIEAVYMGNVLSAQLGQAPARQAAIGAGIPVEADATTVNKVCASGMKAVMLAAQQLQTGAASLVAAGGMESMSRVPHYAQVRMGTKMGDLTLTDGLQLDGLTDAYHHYHMGVAAELCVEKYGLTREAQDAFALQSYAKAREATENGAFAAEIAPITLPGKGGDTMIDRDEDIYKLIAEKVPGLKPTFKAGGTITPANASNLNDGAAALVLATQDAINRKMLTPIARIVAFADAAQAPEWYTTAPSVAIQKALNIANLKLEDMDLIEINEAYAAVVLANSQILGMDPDRINVHGGAVAIGHPLGASGARIVVTLVHALRQHKKRYGLAAICNGGGGASAIIIENLNC